MYEAEERQWWYAGQRAIADRLLRSELADERPGAPGADASRLPLRVLDAGCGTGGNLAGLGTLGRAVGVDLSSEAIAFCHERGVAVARGSILTLPFQDASFDLVTSFDVLYHAWVTDDRGAVAELARVLRPGGLLLVRVPALRILWGAHDVEVQSRHRYTRAEIGRLLEAAGLELRRASYCNALLFPLLLARRSLDRLLGREGSDVGFLPAPLEWTFRTALLVEAALIARGLSFPVGASVVALARKPVGRQSVTQGAPTAGR
jgi:SAM-dependent methyltransferase